MSYSNITYCNENSKGGNTSTLCGTSWTSLSLSSLFAQMVNKQQTKLKMLTIHIKFSWDGIIENLNFSHANLCKLCGSRIVKGDNGNNSFVLLWNFTYFYYFNYFVQRPNPCCQPLLAEPTEFGDFTQLGQVGAKMNKRKVPTSLFLSFAFLLHSLPI